MAWTKTVSTPHFQIQTHKIGEHVCGYNFVAAGTRRILCGIMFYQYKDMVSAVVNEYQFDDRFGESEEDRRVFPEVLRYLAVLEQEFKRQLDKIFAPQRDDIDGLCTKRVRVCGAVK